MNDVIEVENIVDSNCMRVIHLIANRELDISALHRYGTAAGMIIDTRKEAGTWHLWARWPYRGVLDIQAHDWPKFRRLVVWNLDGCNSVRDAIEKAFMHFWVTFKFQPAFVFMKKLPKGVENAQDCEGLVLLEAEWMLEKCVAVGGRMR